MDATADAERRLVRLEEDLCFLGEEVHKLEEVVASQQRRLDELLNEAREVARRMRDMLALLRDGPSLGNEVPPHYLEHFWQDINTRGKS